MATYRNLSCTRYVRVCVCSRVFVSTNSWKCSKHSLVGNLCDFQKLHIIWLIHPNRVDIYQPPPCHHVATLMVRPKFWQNTYILPTSVLFGTSNFGPHVHGYAASVICPWRLSRHQHFGNFVNNVRRWQWQRRRQCNATTMTWNNNRRNFLNASATPK